MMGSLYAGVSGLKNHQTKMNVIGNNIANVNTIGFKPGRVNFEEAFVQTYKGAGRPSAVTGGTNPIQMGLGIQVGTIDNLYLQGGLETTGQITDLAIQGSGFFILGDGFGNRYYTRAGAFGFDADSNLVDPASGLYVLGRMADSDGNIPSLATTNPITLPFGQQDPANPTTEITLANNLDASASDSRATLVNAGDSNIVTVSGIAANGVGGEHRISITGNQPTQASFTGTNVGNDGAGGAAGNLTLIMSLGSLGVTDFTNFGFSVDGSPVSYIQGLDANSTVSELISSINQIDGISADLVGGEIQVTRDKAGASYYFESTTGTHDPDGGPATSGNVVGVIFGLDNDNTFMGNNGVNDTFAITDVFTPDRGYGPSAGPVTYNLTNSSLELVYDDNSGLVTGIAGLGGGGVEIKSNPPGITDTGTNDLIVSTEPTLHSTSINVYDSQGGKHTLTIEFFKSLLENRWEWQATTIDNEVINVGQSGYVAFNGDGSLNSFDYNSGASYIGIDPNNGADVMEIVIDAGTAGNYDGLTGMASGSHTASIIGQDGYGMGILEDIDIDISGNISGIFSNGVTRVLAQIMLADFNNQAGLRKAGRSLFQASANSGEAVEGFAGTTISGTFTSGALESSAVDIAQEFTNMITTQRGFQANARIITTSNDMLEELVNIKR